MGNKKTDRNTKRCCFLIVSYQQKFDEMRPKSCPQRDFAPAVGASTPKVIERTRGRQGLRLQSSDMSVHLPEVMPMM